MCVIVIIILKANHPHHHHHCIAQPHHHHGLHHHDENHHNQPEQCFSFSSAATALNCGAKIVCFSKIIIERRRRYQHFLHSYLFHKKKSWCNIWIGLQRRSEYIYLIKLISLNIWLYSLFIEKHQNGVYILQWSQHGCCFIWKLQICFCFLISASWSQLCFEIWSKVGCGGDIIWPFWNYIDLTGGMKKGLGVFSLSDKRLIAVTFNASFWTDKQTEEYFDGKLEVWYFTHLPLATRLQQHR